MDISVEIINECREKGIKLVSLTKSIYLNAGDNATAFNTPDVISAVDELKIANAWLGKIKGGLGIETPYKKDGKRKAVADIEKPDVSSDLQFPTITKEITLDVVVERIDQVREMIVELIDVVSRLRRSGSHAVNIARTNVYSHLCQARFYLGYELGRLHDEAKKEKKKANSLSSVAEEIGEMFNKEQADSNEEKKIESEGDQKSDDTPKGDTSSTPGKSQSSSNSKKNNSK